jgi:hypothetical protein
MDSLKRRLAKGRTAVECDHSYEMVQVRSLIDDVTSKTISKRDPRVIAKRLTTQFNEEELRACCFELDIDYEDLGGRGRADKARELVKHLQRRGRLSELIAYIDRERP